jgi:hypothetical protein
MMANIAVVAGNNNAAAGAAAAIAAETTSSQEEEDRALLDLLSAVANSRNAFDELLRSGPFARTLGRVQEFVDERIGQLETFHPDNDALHEDIGFQYLHDRYVRTRKRDCCLFGRANQWGVLTPPSLDTIRACLLYLKICRMGHCRATR